MTKELNENYKGAFDGSLGFGNKPALILVDLVQAYFQENSPLYARCEDALASAICIRDEARNAGIPVIYTNVVYKPDGSDGGMFYRKVPALSAFVKGNPLGDWPDGLDPTDDELIISKQFASAFFGTPLAQSLNELGIDTLIITGVSTSGCIRATCIDAISSGFIPIVVSDACGDRHQGPHDANLFDMNAKYGDVVDEAAALHYLKEL